MNRAPPSVCVSVCISVCTVCEREMGSDYMKKGFW